MYSILYHLTVVDIHINLLLIYLYKVKVKSKYTRIAFYEVPTVGHSVGQKRGPN